MARSAHARTNGLGSPKSFWKQLIDNNASFGRLKYKTEYKLEILNTLNAELYE